MATITAEQRVAQVVRGVVRQAMADAGVAALRLATAPSPASGLIEQWCGVRFDSHATALSVSTATKTELLLADATAPADLHPLRDLYASELAWWCTVQLPPEVAELAAGAGDIGRLDGALRLLLDERRPPAAAFAGFPHMRAEVMQRLQATRFRRERAGLVPKLGARTIGIDLLT